MGEAPTTENGEKTEEKLVEETDNNNNNESLNLSGGSVEVDGEKQDTEVKMEGECESNAKKSEDNPAKKEKNKLKMPKVIKDMFAKKEKMTVTDVGETSDPVENANNEEKDKAVVEEADEKEEPPKE